MFPSPVSATHNDWDGHDTHSRPACMVVTRVAFHALALALALAPAVGSRDVRTFPSLSAATHSDTVGHDTPSRFSASLNVIVFHAEGPAAGRVELLTWGPPLTTHNLTDGHETSVAIDWRPTEGPAQLFGPAAGWVDATTVPVYKHPIPQVVSVPTATHSDRDGHETPWPPSFRRLAIRPASHDGRAVAGSVELSTRPASSNATHSEGDEQEIAITALAPSTPASRQEEPPAAGFGVAAILPRASAMTHDDADPQASTSVRHSTSPKKEARQ
jgi:hypothetical protein